MSLLKWTWECIHLFESVLLFSSDKYPEVELLDNIVVVFLIFWGTSILFPQWLHQSAFLPTVHEGSLSSTSSPALVSRLSDNSHCVRWYLIVVLMRIFRWLVIWTPFHIPVSHLYVFLGKCLLRSAAHFLSGLFGSFFCWLVWVFLLWNRLLFHFVEGVLCCAEALGFDGVSFFFFNCIYYLFICLFIYLLLLYLLLFSDSKNYC